MIESMTFPATPASIASTREFARGVVTEAPDEARDAMILMISELATNAVRHARTDFTVTTTHTESMVEVSVSDHGGGTPLKRDPPHTEPTGRGLLIVDTFSDEWGITRSGRTTVIWFRLAYAKHRQTT